MIMESVQLVRMVTFSTTKLNATSKQSFRFQRLVRNKNKVQMRSAEEGRDAEVKTEKIETEEDAKVNQGNVSSNPKNKLVLKNTKTARHMEFRKSNTNLANKTQSSTNMDKTANKLILVKSATVDSHASEIGETWIAWDTKRITSLVLRLVESSEKSANKERIDKARGLPRSRKPTNQSKRSQIAKRPVQPTIKRIVR